RAAVNELPIVVTCTDRKASPPAADLQARTLTGAGLPERAKEWAQRLRTAPGPRTPLEDLYKGDQWQRALALTHSASRPRFTPPPAAALRPRPLPGAAPPGGAKGGAQRLRPAPGPRTPLEALYKGDQWQRALALPHSASRAGFPPRLYAASAGLGLRPV